MTPRQLTLDLALRPALAREDFLVAPSNQAAVALVDQWPNWPAHGAVISGPPGSGKSHLAAVWQNRAGALGLSATDLRIADVAVALQSGALIVEDADRRGVDERALFHALNMAKQEGGFVLLTATTPVSAWAVALPDLRSRLNALPQVAIEAPDDALLRGVVVKLFADRQIAVSEVIVAYMVLRMPRSLEAARSLVDAIDRAALEQGAEVTRPFVAKVLEAALSPGLFQPDQ
jgi:chromosomal replication initiation ATPase DnaA